MPRTRSTDPDDGNAVLGGGPSAVRDDDLTHLMLRHRFGMEEVVTKLSILRDEFALMHASNPIENIVSRLKSPESLAEKLRRKGIEPSLDAIRSTITDIAGVRVTCSFVSDVYRVFDLLAGQDDITVLDVRDYIATPKPNGYRSHHALIEIPVYLSDGAVPVVVELQMRTIAMDFWASLEHKIHYKYRGAVPEDLAERLCDAADAAHELDTRMESLHQEVRHLGGDPVADLPSDVRDDLGRPADAAPEELIARLQRLVRD